MTPRGPFLLAVMGVTGSGKSTLAEDIARQTCAQLINADAFQVYRGLDIGTNKPKDKSVYELLDVVGANEEFSVGAWIKLVLPVLAECFAKGQNVVVVGGTGLYVRALFEKYDGLGGEPDPVLREELRTMGLPELLRRLDQVAPGATLDRANPVRVVRAIERAETQAGPFVVRLPEFSTVKLAVVPKGVAYEEGLAARVKDMWDAGWPEEVEGLFSLGLDEASPGMRAIGYQTVFSFLQGNLKRKEAEAEIALQTRRYAKRQRTWLRTEPSLVEAPCDLTADGLVNWSLERIMEIQA